MSTLTVMVVDQVTDQSASVDVDFVINGVSVDGPGDQVANVGTPV